MKHYYILAAGSSSVSLRPIIQQLTRAVALDMSVWLVLYKKAELSNPFRLFSHNPALVVIEATMNELIQAGAPGGYHTLFRRYCDFPASFSKKEGYFSYKDTDSTFKSIEVSVSEDGDGPSTVWGEVWPDLVEKRTSSANALTEGRHTTSSGAIILQRLHLPNI